MTTSTPKIFAPRVIAVFEADSGDLTEVNVQTDQRDQFAFSMVRRVTPNIPSVQDDPQLWTAFLTWHALKRSGVPEAKATKWDDFLQSHLVSVAVVNADEMGDGGPNVGPLEQTTA